MKEKDLIAQLAQETLITPQKLEKDLDELIKNDPEIDYLEAIELYVSSNDLMDYEDLIPVIQSSKTIIQKIQYAATVSGKIKQSSSFFN